MSPDSPRQTPIRALLPCLCCLLLGLARCVDMTSAYNSINWQSLVLIVGMMPFSIALQRTGGVEDAEMYRAFNMGAGIIVALAEPDAATLLEAQPTGWRIGEVVARDEGDPAVTGLPD